jgi:hypothetical protein
VVVSTSVSYLSSNFKEKVVLDIADRLAFGHGEADGELAGEREARIDQGERNLRLPGPSYLQWVESPKQLQRMLGSCSSACWVRLRRC